MAPGGSGLRIFAFFELLSVCRVALCAAAVVLACDTPAIGQCQYEVTGEIRANPCPPFGTWPTVFANAMNNLGQVVGYWNDCDNSNEHGFIWSAETGVVELIRPPGVIGIIPEDINDNGVICGTWRNQNVPGISRGFVRWADGAYTELDTLSGAGWGMAHAINNNNVVVGERSVTKDVAPRNAFIWSQKNGFTDLGIMHKFGSVALDVNNAGVVIGYRGSIAGSTRRAFIYNGTIEIINPPQGAFNTYLARINNNGVCVGSADTSPSQSIGIIYVEGSLATVLPLPGHESAGFRSVNDLNQMLFASRDSDISQTYPLLYVNGILTDLSSNLAGDYPFTLRAPIDINNDGQILVEASGGRGVVLERVDNRAADLNADCIVDVSDLLILFQYWATSFDPCDLDKSGFVNVVDLFILLSDWN